MANENEPVSVISFDPFGVFVRVNEVRTAVRAPEETDCLLEVLYDL